MHLVTFLPLFTSETIYVNSCCFFFCCCFFFFFCICFFFFFLAHQVPFEKLGENSFLLELSHFQKGGKTILTDILKVYPLGLTLVLLNKLQWNLDNSKSKGPNSFVWIIETLNNWGLKCIHILQLGLQNDFELLRILNYWSLNYRGSTVTCHAASNFQPIRLLYPGCWYKFTYLMANSVDPDQLASSENNWSGSTLFAKARYIQVQQDKG